MAKYTVAPRVTVCFFVNDPQQHMNYFELYNLPILLHVDAATIKQKFYELSRKYHPDFYTAATADEQADMLQKSSDINKAFKTLSNADETIKYTLQLKGLLEEEEKYQLPNAFLMEMLELNEQAMDAKMEGDTAKQQQLQAAIHQLSTTIYEPVKQIVEHYQESATTEKELLQVKEYYFKKKYLNRILASSN